MAAPMTPLNMNHVFSNIKVCRAAISTQSANWWTEDLAVVGQETLFHTEWYRKEPQGVSPSWVISGQCAGICFKKCLLAHGINFVKKIMLLLNEKQLSDQVTILHMPQQLSCRGMCKVVTWLDQQKQNDSNMNIAKIFTMSSATLYEIGPRSADQQGLKSRTCQIRPSGQWRLRTNRAPMRSSNARLLLIIEVCET